MTQLLLIKSEHSIPSSFQDEKIGAHEGVSDSLEGSCEIYFKILIRSDIWTSGEPSTECLQCQSREDMICEYTTNWVTFVNLTEVGVI